MMKGIWLKIQVWLVKTQLGAIKNTLVYPKGDKDEYLKAIVSIKVAILGMFLTTLFIITLITVFSELDVLLRLFVFSLIMILSFPFLYLFFRAYKFSEQVRKNNGLNEAEIWELQNKTQAKLKALTDV